MNLKLLIPVLILAPCAIFGLALIPRMWREKSAGPPPARRRRWSFRAARQEGYARSFPAAMLALTTLVLAMAAVLVEDATAGTVSTVAARVALWAFVAFVVLTAVSATVVLFNVPKFLVPPVARDEPGAIPLWWRGRRSG